MQLLTPFALLMATLMSTTLAFPTSTFNFPTLTSPLRRDKDGDAVSSGVPNTPGSSGSNSTSSGTCSPAIKALAAGIQSNIEDQNNELTTVTALGMVLAQKPMDMTLYGATQSSLMGFVTKGIRIRENNQKLAPSDNGATAGLAKVAMAQMEELNLTMSLAIPSSGSVNTNEANTTVEKLKKDFAGGIDQNKKNLQAATSGCQAGSSTT